MAVTQPSIERLRSQMLDASRIDLVMTIPSGCRVSNVLVLAFLGLVLTGAACEQPVVSQMGQPATVGGVEFQVSGFQVRYLELVDDGKTFEYPEPVLTIPVQVTNKGKKPLTYSPTHRSQQMSEATTPLLYTDPGKEADVPPASKQTINGVFLEEGELPGQITQSTTVEPGKSVKDIFVFEVPDAKQAPLILSLPPTMHRGAVPVLFRIPYKSQKPEGPKVHTLGDAVAVDAATFTVEETEVAYIKTKDTVQGEGYSSEPLLKISYKIANNGEEPITYTPSHRDVAGTRGASLHTSEKAFKRVRFSSTTKAVDQINDDTDIEPGKSVTDYTLFERPSEDVQELTFEYPAKHFGGTGLVRVEIPYEYKDPDLPKELEKAKKGD